MYYGYAKLNLRLAVLAREDTGFHQLETVYCLIALHDVLEVDARGSGIELSAEGAELGPVRENSVHRAATGFFALARLRPSARIRLLKRIPAGAGLGGASSDAAATLLALNAQNGHPLGTGELRRLGLSLGSDVPFFLAATPFALAWGRGQRLLTLPPPPSMPALVVVPAERSLTHAAFEALAERRRAQPEPAEPRTIDIGELSDWGGLATHAANDFETILFERLPSLSEIRETLDRAGARIARMSGSGSAIFGIFDRAPDRDSAADIVRARFPDAAVLATTTLDRM